MESPSSPVPSPSTPPRVWVAIREEILPLLQQAFLKNTPLHLDYSSFCKTHMSDCCWWQIIHKHTCVCNNVMLCASCSQTEAGFSGCSWLSSCCWFWSWSGGSGRSAALWCVPADLHPSLQLSHQTSLISLVLQVIRDPPPSRPPPPPPVIVSVLTRSSCTKCSMTFTGMQNGFLNF